MDQFDRDEMERAASFSLHVQIMEREERLFNALVVAELAYKCAEKGMNLQATLDEVRKLLQVRVRERKLGKRGATREVRDGLR